MRLSEAVEKFEKEFILSTIREVGGLKKAYVQLGLSRSAFYRKLINLGIDCRNVIKKGK